MPRYIVTCNFQEFQIHDQNKPGQDPEVIQLDALQDATYHMEFLVKKEHGFNIKLKREGGFPNVIKIKNSADLILRSALSFPNQLVKIRIN